MTADENDKLTNEQAEEKYIRETIMDRRKRKWIGRLFTLFFVILLGIVFGVAASITFVLSQDNVTRMLGIEDPNRAVVTIKERTPTPKPTSTPIPTPHQTYPAISETKTPTPAETVTPTPKTTEKAETTQGVTPVPTEAVSATPVPATPSAAVATPTPAPSGIPVTEAPEPTATPEVTEVPEDPEFTKAPEAPEITQAAENTTPTPSGEATVPEVTPTESAVSVTPTPEATGAAEYVAYLSSVMASAAEVVSQVVDIDISSFGTDWFGEKYEITTVSSGLLMGQDGVDILILADYGAVSGAANLKVTFAGQESAKARLYSYDRDFGIAILAVNKSLISQDLFESLDFASFKPEKDMHTGMPVVALGNANGYKNSIAIGIISSPGSSVQVRDGKVKFFTTDWPDYDGSSAFVFSLDGEVCGMVTHSYKDHISDNITSCITLDAIKPVISKLLNGGSVSFFGITGKDISDAVADIVETKEGIYVNEVIASSPAYRAGLKNGDIIVKINDKKVKGLEDLMELVATLSPGAVLDVRYIRMDRDGIMQEKAMVTLGSK